MKDELNIVKRIKELNIYLNSILINYPRKEFVIRNKMEEMGYDMLELVYFANTMENREMFQKRVLSKVAMLNYYLELSYDRKYINYKNLNRGCNILREIRKMVYGWMRVNGSKV